MPDLKAPRQGRFSFVLVGIGALCFLLAWLAPNHYLPWLSFHNEAPMFAALIALALARCADAHHVTAPRAMWWVPAAILGLIAVQLACGVLLYSGHALVAGIYVAGIATAWWLGAANIRRAPEPDRSLAAAASLLVLAAVLSAGVAVLQWLRMEVAFNIYAVELAPGSRPSGNLAQPNLLATLLVMGVVATGLLWHLSRLRTWHALGLLIYLSFGLVMTESRAGLLSALCVGALVLLRGGVVGWAGGWRAVALWWALLGVLRWLWTPLNEILLLQSPRTLQAGVDNVRLVLWKQILFAIEQSPWMGYGWNQTQVAQKIGVQAAPGEWSTDYAHNVALDIMAWCGIPLGAVLLGAILWWLGRTVQRARSTRELLMFCSVIPVLAHSLLEFPFAYAFFLFPVACTLGALHALQVPTSWPVRPAAPVWRRLIVTGVLGAYALVAGRVFVEYLEAEEDMRVMRFELRRIGQRPADHVAPRLLLLNQLDEMLKLGRIQPSRGMAPEVLARMGRANAYQSWATLHLNYVVALGLNGEPEEAARQLRILRDLYGPQSYRQASAEIVAQQKHLYPELAAVELP